MYRRASVRHTATERSPRVDDANEGSVGSGPLTPYPWLDVRLQQLQGHALHFWGDAAVREQALRSILDAFINGDQGRMQTALHVVDDAVVAGMQALGFPRGPVNGIRLRRIGALGLKRPTCELEIDALDLRRALTSAHSPDEVIETWIHESAHARVTPWAANYRTEADTWRGYEEGLAEGCAKLIGYLGALSTSGTPYERYRAGYDRLVLALDTNRESLYRHLWPHHPGTVRQSFTDTVDDLYHQRRRRHLTLDERRDVQDLADEIFDSSQEDVFDPVIARRIEQDWRRILP